MPYAKLSTNYNYVDYLRKTLVCYQYLHNKAAHTIHLTVTTSGNGMSFHVLLPSERNAKIVTVNNKTMPFTQSMVEHSRYVDFKTDAAAIQQIQIQYE